MFAPYIVNFLARIGPNLAITASKAVVFKSVHQQHREESGGGIQKKFSFLTITCYAVTDSGSSRNPPPSKGAIAMTTTPNRSGVSPSAINPRYLLDNEDYRERAGRIIDQVISWAGNNQWRISKHFNSYRQAGQCKPYRATLGQGIELAMMITQYAPTLCNARAVSMAAAVKKPCGQGRADQAQGR